MPLDRMLHNLIKWQRAEGPPTPVRALTVEEARERYLRNAIRPRSAGGGAHAAVSTADRMVDSADGSSFRVRVYAPETDEGRVLTYLHGGGWSLGDVDSHDWACRTAAVSLGAVVVSVDYRRAPEFPYPTPLHDAMTAARWTARCFPGREHVIAGDSAGANMALGVALDARDTGDVEFAGQLLVYPVVDPTLRFASNSACAEGYLLSVDDLAHHYDQYLPDPRRRSDPAVDLLNADLRNLPPTVVATAEFDPLHDEGVELAEKLRATGVPVRHVPGPGLVHGYFLMQDIVPAASARARLVLDELAAVLSPERGAKPVPFG
ncbi:acetyl esterase [Saccharopolyspora kobensis]|uniref:Acetyl esterase n=1 Tax=Saccharopolyspora kobensis TaxID=146035 RepID=A0A1H6A661_9PSEU|nr:alpha/beta hydrolase [Saccharopolyspora kobensis]SEG43216.1 acetyl esterase [Saccharopolyspora kobensis]SFE19079.1 acetyl esterase [Saccharopolyspora kobensis]